MSVSSIWCIILLVGMVALSVAILINDNLNKRKISSIGKISFKESMDLVDLPIITFYNEDNKFNFLLDTGSSTSVINQSTLSTFNHEETGKVGELFGMEGNKQSLTYVKAILRYKDAEYPEEFQVADLSQAFGHIKQEYGVTLHGIIGNSFFQKYKYVLDFSELVAYSMS